MIINDNYWTVNALRVLIEAIVLIYTNNDLLNYYKYLKYYKWIWAIYLISQLILWLLLYMGEHFIEFLGPII